VPRADQPNLDEVSRLEEGLDESRNLIGASILGGHGVVPDARPGCRRGVVIGGSRAKTLW
jgi:hypothetical protein